MRHDCWWSHCGRWLINKHRKSTQEPGDATQLGFSRWDIMTHHSPTPHTLIRYSQASFSATGTSSLSKGRKVEPIKLRTSWKWWTRRWSVLGFWLYYLPLMKNESQWPEPPSGNGCAMIYESQAHIRFQCKTWKRNKWLIQNYINPGSGLKTQSFEFPSTRNGLLPSCSAHL